MSDEISLILHHNAKFIQNANGALEYVDGEFYVWEEVEKDLVNVWTPQELCKAYCNFVKLLTNSFNKKILTIWSINFLLTFMSKNDFLLTFSSNLVSMVTLTINFVTSLSLCVI